MISAERIAEILASFEKQKVCKRYTCDDKDLDPMDPSGILKNPKSHEEEDIEDILQGSGEQPTLLGS